MVHPSELRGSACNECWQTLPQLKRLIGSAYDPWSDTSWEREQEMREERLMEDDTYDTIARVNLGY